MAARADNTEQQATPGAKPGVALHADPSSPEAQDAMWEAALAGVEGELDEDDSVTIGLLRGARRNDASRYGVSAKRRHARILQIFGIVRKYDVFGGITPVKFRRMLEELSAR